MSFTLFAFASLMLAASDAPETRPATPVNRVTPDFPASCMPKSGETMAPQNVIVVYRVTRKGEVEDVRVRETTDPCFNETAIAAVRGWRFEPAKSGGAAIDQEDIETTFTFVLGEPTATRDFDARPLKRYPPRYPQHCMDRADSKEAVYVEFDVTADGATANARVVESTNNCLNSAALAAVKKWIYRPKMDDGVAVERKGVQTMITFELYGRTDPPPNRPIVGRKLNSVAADIRANKDPQAILADLAEIEAKYGADFTRLELMAFHQMRGAARLSAKDYRGALDDFRVAQKLGVSGEAGEAIAKTVEQLEAVIAAEDAAAPSETNAPAPDESDDP